MNVSATDSASVTSRSSLTSVSPLTAACSRIATGALLWLRPTTSTLTSPPPLGLRRELRAGQVSVGLIRVRPARRSALRVEGQDLQLDGQVDLPHVHPVRDGEHHRREVQDAGHAG